MLFLPAIRSHRLPYLRSRQVRNTILSSNHNDAMTFSEAEGEVALRGSVQVSHMISCRTTILAANILLYGYHTVRSRHMHAEVGSHCVKYMIMLFVCVTDRE